MNIRKFFKILCIFDKLTRAFSLKNKIKGSVSTSLKAKHISPDVLINKVDFVKSLPHTFKESSPELKGTASVHTVKPKRARNANEAVKISSKRDPPISREPPQSINGNAPTVASEPRTSSFRPKVSFVTFGAVWVSVVIFSIASGIIALVIWLNNEDDSLQRSKVIAF